MKIPDFTDYAFDKAKIPYDLITYHNCIGENPFNKKQTLFLGSPDSHNMVWTDSQEDADVAYDLEDLLLKVHGKIGFYGHKWEKGDVLIWDNL